MSGNLLEVTLQRAFENAKKRTVRRSRAKPATQDTLKRELQRGALTLDLVPFDPAGLEEHGVSMSGDGANGLLYRFLDERSACQRKIPLEEIEKELGEIP